jgi:hypothetical protein
MAEPLAAHYDVDLALETLPTNGSSVSERIQHLMARDNIPVQRWHKKGPRQIDIRPGIIELEAMPSVAKTITISMRLHESTTAKAKPLEVLQTLLDLDEDRLRCLRLYKHETFVHTAEQLVPLMHYQPQPSQGRKVCV